MGFFPAQNHGRGFFWVLGLFYFQKKAYEIWLFWAFFGVKRKLLKLYLQNTNFNMLFMYF